jgi:hypothetical protein
MPQAQSQEKAGSLEALAQAHFPRERGFTSAEWKLLTRATEGELAVCGPSSSPADPTNDPSKAERGDGNVGWSREREIGADLIRWLCVDHRAKEQVDPLGVRILGAKITGELDLDLVIAPFPITLWHCALTGETVLRRAEIPQVDLQGTWTRSIRADGAIIKGSVFLRNGFHADGEVRLLEAKVGGDLDCHGGTFNGSGGHALSADEVDVGGGVILGGKFTAQGEVRLVGARIGGHLVCADGTFNNPEGNALDADFAQVRGNVYLSWFSAYGVVALRGARIEGGLDCRWATFREATLDVRSARASFLWDDRDHWPQPGKLHLDGLVYGQIGEGPKDARTRLEWLALQPEEKPFPTQPYLQLAKVLREAGDYDGAVKVLIEMERLRRLQADQYRPDRQAISWLFREFAGYGYDPARSAWAIAALSGLGWILYRRSYLLGGMVPTEKDASGDFNRDGQTPSRYERFAPLMYSLENSVPLVKLGQTDKWQPNPDLGASPSRNAKWIKSAGREKSWPVWLCWLERLLVWAGLLAPIDSKAPPSRFGRFGTSPRFLRWFLWFQILLGWVLATLFVAGVTGIIRKD